MNKKTPLLILLLCLCIAALLALGALVYQHSAFVLDHNGRAGSMLDDLNENLQALHFAFEQALPSREADTESTEAHRPKAEETGQTQEPLTEEMEKAQTREVLTESNGQKPEIGHPAATSALQLPPTHHVIFVGDSRTVGMGKAEAHTGDSCTYVGESGEGYRWFIEEGLDQMDLAIRSWPKAPVIFNLGVNDCDHIEAYIEVYREVEKGYPDTDFFYLSVNPVTEESANVPLSDVLSFNRRLKSAFPDRYIDSCSWMLQEGFEDVDGVHYSQAQYCLIHDFAVAAAYQLLS